MTEPGPISFSLLGVAVAILGPVLGPYALLVFAAGVGAGLALSAEAMGETPRPRWAGFKFLVGGMLVSLLLTGPVVWGVSNFTAVPANIAFIPVAFALGLCRNTLLDFIRKVLDALAAGVGSFLNAAANRRGGGR